MKITQLHYSRGATINVGNFNNVKVECAATVAIDEGDDAEKVFAKLRAWVETRVAEETRRYQGKG